MKGNNSFDSYLWHTYIFLLRSLLMTGMESLRWKALNYWKSVAVMRQPVSNQCQPLKSYVIPSINWSPLWIFCLIYKLQRTFCRKYFLISLVHSGFSLRENENDGGLPESARLQKGRMLLLELESGQKKFWLENLILLMLHSH